MKRYLIISLLFMYQLSYAQKKIGKDIGLWKIENGVIILEKGANDDLAKEYWNYIMGTLPNQPIKKYIYSLRLYTDGEEGDLGGITPMDASNTKWQIELDVKDFDLHEKDEKKIIDYQHTLIHEFGHLITLNITQIEPSDDEYQDDAKGYLTSEGYAIKNSYLDKFVSQFWKNDQLFKWDKIDQIRNQRKRENRLFDFYLNNPNDFVTDYAAESPEEDLAESWTYFVMDNITTNTHVKEQKVTFFNQFEEIKSYRLEIRKKLKTLPKDYLKKFSLED